MILRDLGIIFVEIPKNGSSTVSRAVSQLGYVPECSGHKTLSFLIDAFPEYDEVVAVVRDPTERLVSALNYEFFNSSKSDLDSKMRKIIKAYPSFYIYRPQVSYLNVDVPVSYYTLDNIDQFCNKLGWSSEPLHENKSHRRFSTEEVISHPLYPEVMKIYESDQELFDSQRTEGASQGTT